MNSVAMSNYRHGQDTVRQPQPPRPPEAAWAEVLSYLLGTVHWGSMLGGSTVERGWDVVRHDGTPWAGRSGGACNKQRKGATGWGHVYGEAEIVLHPTIPVMQ